MFRFPTGDTGGSLVAAAQAGRIGEVVRLGRRAQGLTQHQLAEQCKVSQSTISRIECSHDVRDVRILRVVARELQFPPALVGLADVTDIAHITLSREPRVNRREFLGATATALATAVIPTQSGQLPNAIRAVTMAQRRLDSDTPSQDLAEPVTAHLRLASRRRAATVDPLTQRTISAEISEIAGFSGWLRWDMHDLGSARMFYSTAIKAAASAEDAALYAYMLGSLAAVAVYEGNGTEGRALLRRAAARLGPEHPMIAVAWLSSLEAIAQADARNERATWKALERADEAVALIPSDRVVPWPWLFQFDHEKVARHRLTAAVRLHRPSTALAAAGEITRFLHLGHPKQRGTLQLDLAEAHLQAGEAEEAFRIAIAATELGTDIESRRTIYCARLFRRSFKGSPTAPAVRELDDRIHAAQF